MIEETSYQKLHKKDFIVKNQDLSRTKKGKRVYLNDFQTQHLMKELTNLLKSYVELPRMQVSKKQIIETFITEEALVFEN